MLQSSWASLLCTLFIGVSAFDADQLHELAFLDDAPEIFEANSQEVPDIANTITEISPGSSFLVKLPCLGCPFVIRPYMSSDEHFEETPRSNVLLFNVSISDDAPEVQINYHTVYPLSSLDGSQRDLNVFQAPEYLYEETLRLMVNVSMFDRPFQGVGTAYGTFGLSYDSNVFRTKDPNVKIVLFDVTRIQFWFGREQKQTKIPLDSIGQQILQIVVEETRSDDWGSPSTLRIPNVSLISRAGIGKPGPQYIHYDEDEWDHFGRIGSAGHDWRAFLWNMDRLIANTFPIWAIALLCIPLLWYRRRRRLAARRAAALEYAQRWKSIY